MGTEFCFDHTYVQSMSTDAWDHLRERGFRFSDKTVEHPGSMLCRFLHIGRKESAWVPPRYLEFCEVRDLEALRDMLRARGELEQVFRAKASSFDDYGIVYGHKNYRWKEDSDSRLPGWNFVNFKRDLVTGLGIWVTEYEADPTFDLKSVKSEPLVHENTAVEILGVLYRNDSSAPLAPLADFAGLSCQTDQLALHDGTRIWLTEHENQTDLRGRFDHKSHPFVGVVVRAESMKTFLQTAQPDEVFTWNGRPAARIRMADNAWDLVVV